MAEAKISETFPCTREEFFKIVADYERYPEFLPEVKSCRVIEIQGNRKLVEFQVSVIKTIQYRLWITEEPYKKISWTLDSGDVFKTSDGGWDFKEKGDQVEAEYGISASFNLFVPGPIAKALVSVNLPNMIKAYQKRVKTLYGK